MKERKASCCGRVLPVNDYYRKELSVKGVRSEFPRRNLGRLKNQNPYSLRGSSPRAEATSRISPFALDLGRDPQCVSQPCAQVFRILLKIGLDTESRNPESRIPG